MNGFEEKLEQEARRLARVLKKHNLQFVLAESCTGGMASAALTRIPGISKQFCGSAVVYQSETKQGWLKIRQAWIQRFGTESLEMSQALASQVLLQTPRATVSASITGDLGPSGKIGTVFMACEMREPHRLQVSERVELLELEPKLRRIKNQRQALQLLASQHLLRMVRQLLSDTLR